MHNNGEMAKLKLWHIYIVEYYPVIKMFIKRFMWSGGCL